MALPLNTIEFSLLVLATFCNAQLDLPPISSTQRNGYGFVSSTQTPINSPGNQYDVNYNQFSTGRPNFNNQFSSARPSTLNYPSSTPYSRINPDINNNGFPSSDFGRNPSSTSRPYDDRNRDDRIDINNDPNFRRNDPNFVRNDPNYVGSNPYDFNNPGVDNNNIDNRFNHVDLQQIRDFLYKADEQSSKECTNNVAAQWNFETDVNDATQHAAVSTFT